MGRGEGRHFSYVEVAIVIKGFGKELLGRFLLYTIPCLPDFAQGGGDARPPPPPPLLLPPKKL